MTLSSSIEDFINNDNQKATLLYVSTALASLVFFRGLLYVTRWLFFRKHFFKKPDNSEPIFIKRDGKDVKYVKCTDNTKSYYFNVPPTKRWKITNEIVSLIHAIISGFWAFGVLIEIYAGDDYRNYENGFYYSGALLCMVSLSYFILDTIDTVASARGFSLVELTAHHVLSTIGVLLPFTTGKYMQLVLMGLVMEVNSIFLHTRILMMYKGANKKSKAFKIVSLTTAITFVIFRLFPSLYMVVLFLHYAISGNGDSSIIALILGGSIVFGLLTSNCIMFARLIRSDFIKNKKSSKKSSKKSGKGDSKKGKKVTISEYSTNSTTKTNTSTTGKTLSTKSKSTDRVNAKV
uniref:TLC domain-containing protein n=1 Tax=Strongyloides papillosus TaxID=174720 RepID=A0A0N5B2A1_STREA